MDERRVVVVGYDGIELVDVATVTSCLDMANRLGTTPAYAVRFGRENVVDPGQLLSAESVS